MQNVKFLLSFFFLLTINVVKGQNLVPNHSFENFDTCPIGNSEIYRAIPWHQATSGGTPDYYNSCSLGMNVPFGFGYQAAINNGNGYVGVYGYSILFNWSNIREYIQVELFDTLQSYHYYNISFFVNLCNECGYAINKMGALISDSAVYGNDTSYLPYVPQIESTGILNDTLNWIEISGYYQAHGGEKFITIGNFRSDSLTVKLLLDPSLYPFAYYFIDSVTVIDCTATGIIESNAIKFHLLENPVGDALQFTSVTKLTRVFIYDMVGNKLREIVLNQNNSTYTVNVADLKDGMYLLMAEDRNKKRGVRKFVKQ